jgi:predicted ABC-type exoprotein transport system permease subunit
MAKVDEARFQLSSWQQVSLTYLEGKDHWTAFARIVAFTPLLWLHWPIATLLSRGTLQGHGLLPYAGAVFYFCGFNAIAMLISGRHRLNLLAWIAVPALVSLLMIPLFFSFTNGSLQGTEKSMGPLMASNLCSGALGWILAMRVLPWILEKAERRSAG